MWGIMATDIVTEFRHVLSQLQKKGRSGEQQRLKETVLELLPGIRELADKGNANAQYRLAFAYPSDSNKFIHYTEKAFNKGITAAGLDLAKALVESHGGQKSMQKAAKAIEKILQSNDSFIKAQTNEFIGKNPKIAKLIQEPKLYSQYSGLLFSTTEKGKALEPSLSNAPTLT
jgi:hypothetical protein